MYREMNDEFIPFGPWQRGFQRGVGGFRAGRGMIEPAILHVLSEKPMHGYEIISTFEEKSHGMWRPSAGSIYPTLQLLEEKGFITSKDVNGKKVYELTEEGKAEADDKISFGRESWGGKATQIRNFHHDMGRIMMSMRSIGRKGTDEQRQALSKAIHEFRETVEHIVKEKK